MTIENTAYATDAVVPHVVRQPHELALVNHSTERLAQEIDAMALEASFLDWRLRVLDSKHLLSNTDKRIGFFAEPDAHASERSCRRSIRKNICHR
jgi:hypothetical protein